ncbi:multicopper oxidase-domain-containing protein [Lasiosphaeris hirsuta]|uniref:Multicopper oxidase-domain-containing protein n=1 Tax=Lasiosphaeris hirsuta TaxID=260670 RepID=A0AA40BD16_9PEZI|nr:multicopper oxidase-domain-containing protein [Lasiosphaeris hirsuta]
MDLWGRFWVLATRLLGVQTTLSAFERSDQPQSPMRLAEPTKHLEPVFVPPVATDPGPVFRPPGRRHDKGDGSDFRCDYSAMTGWESCSTPQDRSCWLINKATGERYDINTDYETKYPTGITREYFLNITKWNITADGYTFPGATVFNNSYPGPWIQACWGDTVVIHVRNTNPDRGTSIHWHGIRQLNTMHMDGVNGVSQCPIAPNNSFTYEWMAADIPLLMTDWRHGSVFDSSSDGKKATRIRSILLNGTGDVTQFGNPPQKNTSEIPEPYTLVFDEKTGPRPQRYLLRLINASIGSTFVFSIDNHLLSIVSADFVPIYPYLNTSILVGIGQRYNVIVEADPRANGTTQPLDSQNNYWIRTLVADNCGPGISGTKSQNYMQTGILRYSSSSSSTAKPQSNQWNEISMACSDETYTSLRPVLPWIIGDPINKVTGETLVQHVAVRTGSSSGEPFHETFPQAGLAFKNVTGGNRGFTPLQVNFSNPMFLNLDNSQPWDSLWEVFPEGRSGQADWVWLAITVDTDDQTDIAAHPIHLHGHDFAVLQQAENTSFDRESFRLNWLNPPRRDVVLMPANGFIVIAFKADNPGSWLLHCHIAKHASGGLALQILERQADAASMWPPASPAVQAAATLCSSWTSWVSASYTATATPLPDDSGI